jgi:hypothetical protein
MATIVQDQIMDTAPTAQPILQLPTEILHHILQWVEPADLMRLPRVCSAFKNITNSKKLYRDVYLNQMVCA